MRPIVSGLRALRGATLAATILTAASGCDKPIAALAGRADTPASDRAAPRDTLDISGRPRMLYQVFGERSDPRLLPVAALTDGVVRPLVLSDAGWQQFDQLYHKPGTVYTLYRDGRPNGTARVVRPMWDEREGALYSLPHCARPTPLAAARVKAPPPLGYMVEFLATDAALPTSPRRAVHAAGDADPLVAARRIAAAAVEGFGMPLSSLEGLDLELSTVAAGTGDSPTLVISLMDPTSELAESDTTYGVHVFAIADRVGGEYIPTYARVVPANAPGQYRRYVDHLDLTGDGIDELVLEGWTGGQESSMLILQFQRNRWAEVFRGRSNWCLDERAER